MSLIETLRKEHADIRQVLHAIEQDPQSLRGLNARLDTHMYGEEKFVYPELRASGLARRTLEAIEEHHIATVLRRELERMNGREENFGPKVKVFRDYLERHFDEEEKYLFSQVETTFSREKKDAIERAYRSLSSAGVAGREQPSSINAPKESVDPNESRGGAQ